jgi:protein SCO1/2
MAPPAACTPSRSRIGRAASALAWLLAGLIALSIAGCDRGKPSFRNTDVTGAEFGRAFALTDHAGKPRTLEDFRGKLVVMFFGYTQCPDVCPTTLTEMAAAMQLLGAKADGVQVLFVTLDPERDTAELLSAYVPAFDRRFLGLYGDAEATAKVAREFKVFYQKVPGSKPGTYTMDHTAGSYVFDRQGRLRLFVKHGQGADALAEDLRRLLEGA